MNDDLMLAVETSSLRGSVALGRGACALAWRELSAERRHTTELLPAIQDMLAETGVRPADVKIVAFSQGPGSFTGLRVAATLARMWQSAVQCHVAAVPTLEVIACNALRLDEPPTKLAVILDARQGKLFGAVFGRAGETELRTLQAAEMHDGAAWLAGLERPCAVLGEGVDKHRSAVDAAGLEALPEACWWPDARQVLGIGRRLAAAGRFCRPEQIVPAYLRPPECEEVYEKRRAVARARRGE